jgi:hypothetical protein
VYASARGRSGGVTLTSIADINGGGHRRIAVVPYGLGVPPMA